MSDHEHFPAGSQGLFGVWKKVPWTTAYDATTGVHKSLKRVRAQYISPQKVTKRLLWCQLLLARLGLRKGVFTTKVRGCTLDKLCFSDEKLWRKVQTMCPQNKRCWVPKSTAKPDAVKACTDDMQVVMKMSDRTGVMSGLMFSMKHGLGK